MKRLIGIVGALAGIAMGAGLEVVVAPRVSVVEREGITGSGQVVRDDNHLLVFYPNHPDDFGGSGGTGASMSDDGGLTWKQQPDDWPLPKMVDVWVERLQNGDLLAFGMRWAPDPKKRGEQTAKDVPADAYTIAISRDHGRTWHPETAILDCPTQFGVIARPLPHIFEDERGMLFMPAYAWGKRGNSVLVMTSADRGRHWSVFSSITAAAAMAKAGARVTTPWLETTVSPARNGDWLAIVRTGSSAAAWLMAVRSVDQGKTWSAPEKLVAGPGRRRVAGKLPTLQLLPNGALALLTANSGNHCRLYVSADGIGHEWGDANILTSQSGGNTGMTVTGKDSLLVITPANRRIDSWRVTLKPASSGVSSAPAPAGLSFSNGLLSWSAPEHAGNVTGYRITPVLLKPGSGSGETEIYPCMPVQTQSAGTQVDLSRILSPGGTYRFEVAAVDGQGRVSASARSGEYVSGP